MPCKREYLSLLCVATAVLVVAGCSPFKAKVRRDVAVRGASHTPEAIPPAVSQAALRRDMDLPVQAPGRTSTPANGRLDEKAVQLLTLGRLSERQGQTEQAEQLFRKVIETAPEHPEAYHRLAVMQAKAGNFAAAEQLFSKAYKRAPRDAELATDIGYFYYLSSKPRHAEQFLRFALELDRNNEAACNNLALLLGEQGRDDEARTFFQRAGTEAEATANMAFLYAQRGQLDMASQTYSRALTLDSTMKPAAQALLKIARYQEQRPTEVIDVPTPPTRQSATNHTPPAVKVFDAPRPRAVRPTALAPVRTATSANNPAAPTASAATLSVGDLTQSEPQGRTFEPQAEPAEVSPEAAGSSTTGSLFSWLIRGSEKSTQPAGDSAAAPAVSRIQTEMQAPRIGTGVARSSNEPAAAAAKTHAPTSVSMQISDNAETPTSNPSVPAEPGRTLKQAAAPPQEASGTSAEESSLDSNRRGARLPRQGEVIEVSSPTPSQPVGRASVKPVQRPVPAVYETAPDKAGTASLRPCNAVSPAKEQTPESSQQPSKRRVHRRPETDMPAADGESRAPSKAMQHFLNGDDQPQKSSRRTTAYPEG